MAHWLDCVGNSRTAGASSHVVFALQEQRENSLTLVSSLLPLSLLRKTDLVQGAFFFVFIIETEFSRER